MSTPPPPPPPGGYPPPPPSGGYGQPPSMPAGTPPPGGEPSKGRGGLVAWLIGGGVLVVVVVVVAFAVGIFGGGDASTAGSGDCAKINSDKLEKVSCTATDAAYLIKNVTTGPKVSKDRCPDGSYTKHVERIRSGKYARFCMMLNAKQGDCFTGDFNTVPNKVVKATCETKESWKVTQVFDKSNVNLCGQVAEGQARVAYRSPANTYCLRKNGA